MICLRIALHVSEHYAATMSAIQSEIQTAPLGALGEFVSYLDTLSTVLAAPKQASVEALGLAAGETVLDVGCGVGDDVRALADVVGPTGRAVGVDANPGLLATARARTAPDTPADYVVADAHALPFAAAQFHAARTERALQHVAEPQVVVAEMARVVRPGGRIVAMEPDWDTIAVSGGDLALTRAVLRACADAVRHPDAGRRLPEWLELAGVHVERVDALSIPIRSVEVADRVFGLGAAAMTLGADAADAFMSQLLSREARGAFLACATGFGAVGTVR